MANLVHDIFSIHSVRYAIVNDPLLYNSLGVINSIGDDLSKATFPLSISVPPSLGVTSSSPATWTQFITQILTTLAHALRESNEWRTCFNAVEIANGVIKCSNSFISFNDILAAFDLVLDDQLMVLGTLQTVL